MPSILDRLFSAVRAWQADDTPVSSRAPSPIERRRTTRKSGRDLSPPNPDRYPRILGPRATPGDVARALREATRGRMANLCDLASEMRESTTHLASQLSKRTGAVSSATWTMEPAAVEGRAAQKRAAKYADYARMRIEQIDALPDRLEHLCDGIYFGRSALQIDWKRDRDGIGIDALHDIAPKRLSYASDWRIHLYDERGNDLEPELGMWPGIDIRKEWPDRFVVHEPKTLGSEIPTRQGLARVLVYAALFWKVNARFMMEFAEIFGNPWRVALYDKSVLVNDEDIDDLRDELINMSGLSVGVFPKGCEPIFMQAKGTEIVHAKTHDIWCAEISKVVNGATLQTEISGGGSRAAAEVHERGEEKLDARDGKSLAGTCRRDLVFPLIKLNFGLEAAQTLCPVFKLNTSRPEDLDKRAGRIWAFVDRGGEVDADAVRTELTGLKPPDDKAPRLKPLAVAKAPAEDKESEGDKAGAKDEGDKGSGKGSDKHAQNADVAEEDDGA